MTVYGMLPPSEAFPKARAAVLQALEIDERSGKSHDMLAIIKWLDDWERRDRRKQCVAVRNL